MSAGIDRGPLAAARARLARGAPWKAALEALLLELPADQADRLQQVMREGRAAWLALLRAAAGRALFVGDPLSGTPIALARAGFDVVVLARDPLALALCRARAAADAGGAVRVVAADGVRPPFAARAFDLAVVEGGADDALARAALAASRGEVVLIGDNRLAYKRWAGRRGAFRVRKPWELARAALGRRRAEATLAGYRARVARDGVVDVRAFALYPHALDFALIARLDPRSAPGAHPRLYVGPKERENRLKVIGHALGLMPLLTPSFAVIGARAQGRERIERVLDRLAERIGERRPAVEQWIASRGNTTVVQAGRWTIHVPHQPYQELQARRHFQRIQELRGKIPVPEPLFAGAVEGLPVFCERRLAGRTAPQVVGAPILARTFADAARDLARLVVEPDARLDAARFDALIGAKVDLVRAHAAVRSTEAWLDRARAEARERLLGRCVPLVVQHADLRGKHVVLDAQGGVVGYLDWGSSEACDLPLFDLLHLVVHERKQAHGGTAGDAWRAVLAAPAAHERAALDAYCAAIGLEPDARAAIEALYPLLVAAMAEASWDYSRPRWLHASFGL